MGMKLNYSAAQVPWLALVEHDIFCAANKRGDLIAARDEVLKKWGIEERPLPQPPWLQLRLLTLGYLAFVYPREFWHNDKEEIKRCLKGAGEAIPAQDCDLRILRNSIAHADIEILGSDSIIRYNMRRSSLHNEPISISIDDFLKNIDSLSDLFLNLGKKHADPNTPKTY